MSIAAQGTSPSIPIASPKAQYLAHKDEIDEAVARVLDSGWYVLGEEVTSFEEEFAQYVGARHAVAVGNGTDAIGLALVAYGIGPGDEVVTVPHTAVATVAAIERSGASPVLVDIEPAYFAMDPSRLVAALSPRTKAVIPVHLYGHPADMLSILELTQKRGIQVIEDCAQAHGARIGNNRVGTFGDAGCFSFYPTKNLGAFGDGGMVVTQDGELAARLRELREYGWKQRYISDMPGFNSRMDELQAAVLRVKLRHLDEGNARRRDIASRYNEHLQEADIELPSSCHDCYHVYHLYVIRCRERDELQAGLRTRKIGTGIHYPVPVHLQPAYAGRLKAVGELKESERAARHVLSLPMYAELTDSDVENVTQASAECAGGPR